MQLIIEANPRERIRPNVNRYSGVVRAGKHQIKLVADVEENIINPLPTLAKLKGPDIGAVEDDDILAAIESVDWTEVEKALEEDTAVGGVFDKLSKGLSHPAVTGVLTAFNTIPGVAAYTAPAYAAAQAVAAVGADLEKKPPKQRSKAERKALASKLTEETNAQLRKNKVPIVVTEKDISRAIVARTLSAKGGLRALVAMAKPKKIGSDDHMDALALLFAGRAASNEPTEFTSIPIDEDMGPVEEDSGVAGADVEIE